jgi:hypothetical protein
MTTWNKQIENRNFLSPIGFRFMLPKFPKVAYFCQSANIPSINLGVSQQSTPYRGLPLEGFVSYDPLSLSFMIDEDLENYMILHNWIRALGTPNNTTERVEYRNKMESLFGNSDLYADATLTILNSNYNRNFDIVFEDLFPMSLNTLEFNATIDGTEYAMAQVQFQYLAYEVRTTQGVRDKRLD